MQLQTNPYHGGECNIWYTVQKGPSLSACEPCMARFTSTQDSYQKGILLVQAAGDLEEVLLAVLQFFLPRVPAWPAGQLQKETDTRERVYQK